MSFWYCIGGSFGLNKGEWTDDTYHMLVLMDSLCEQKGFVPEVLEINYFHCFLMGHIQQEESKLAQVS